MTLAEQGAELRRIADDHPFDVLDLRPPSDRHKCVVEVDGQPVRVMFTRTRLFVTEMYQLSMSLHDGIRPPDAVVAAVKAAFLPGGQPLPGPHRSVQFMQIIE